MKKIIALLSVLTLIFALASCGGKQTNATGTDAPGSDQPGSST